MVLGASSDFACRVWTLADRRLKVNLTGHSDRVVAARFVGGGDAINAIVTASNDRTIKVCLIPFFETLKGDLLRISLLILVAFTSDFIHQHSLFH